MPYKQRSGTRNQFTWFLTDEEISYLKDYDYLPNKYLFEQFNLKFNCKMSYSRMRHFRDQYGIKKQDKGPAYTDFEKAFFRAHYEQLSNIHIGQFLGRSMHSIEKLQLVLKLRRSPEAEKRLRHLRSCSGARSYHEKIRAGTLQHPASSLHDSFIAGQITKGTGLKREDVPPQLIEMKRNEFKLKRVLKKIATNGKDNNKA